MSEAKKTLADIIVRVAEMKECGLSTFQAMAAALNDDDFDRLFETVTVMLAVSSYHVASDLKDPEALFRDVRKIVAKSATAS